MPERQADSTASNVVSDKKTGVVWAGRQRGTSVGTRLQRAGIFEGMARLFGGGTFSDQELQEYLGLLDKTGEIENHYDSDNKAREVVRRWQQGGALYILPVRRKVLLINEMLSGYTGAADEQAILILLRGSTDAEFIEILTSVGLGELQSNIQGEDRKELDAMVATRRKQQRGQSQQQAETTSDREIFSGETVLRAQQLFTSNAELEHSTRRNCIEIVRTMAPQLFAQDPELAEWVRLSLSKLKGATLTMPDAGRVLAELGVASGPIAIRFNNGNGDQEPTAMTTSAWDTIVNIVGGTQGWHVFGLAIFDGYHSVTLFVDNRPDGPRVYWADQWAIAPGEDFGQEPGSVSGFRRYENAGFDRFIEEKTNKWWNDVHSPNSKCGKSHLKTWDRSCRYTATLKIWHLRSGR
jgi:hypothetical protein